jgi:isoaspartyl peptidase/L-asparaginase-like protein (Ntn-hydrolase superfamily)
MKRPGRVGDSPIIGSGLYCDGDIGGAAATGVGEDIMKGCLSYEIVRTMSAGASPEEACESALRRHVENMARRGRRPEEISVVALDREGRFGAATTLGRFPYICAQQGGKPEIRAVSCKF